MGPVSWLKQVQIAAILEIFDGLSSVWCNYCVRKVPGYRTDRFNMDAYPKELETFEYLSYSSNALLKVDGCDDRL